MGKGWAYSTVLRAMSITSFNSSVISEEGPRYVSIVRFSHGHPPCILKIYSSSIHPHLSSLFILYSSSIFILYSSSTHPVLILPASPVHSLCVHVTGDHCQSSCVHTGLDPHGRQDRGCSQRQGKDSSDRAEICSTSWHNGPRVARLQPSGTSLT
jgi:hypothetical protein